MPDKEFIKCLKKSLDEQDITDLAALTTIGVGAGFLSGTAIGIVESMALNKPFPGDMIVTSIAGSIIGSVVSPAVYIEGYAEELKREKKC